MPTLLDKLWSAHEIRAENGVSLMWVDRHLVHEGSHHAFAKLADRNLAVAQPALTFGVADHYAPTRRRDTIADPKVAVMLGRLERNCARHGIELFGLRDPRQGIVHVIGTGTGSDPARVDDQLRGQPHIDAWCFRGLGLWNRGHAGCPCSGHANLVAGQTPRDADHIRRLRRPRRDRQGHGAALDFTAWHRGGGGARGRIRGRCHSGTVDGGAHDPVQPVDRRRRAAGHDCTRRHHL